MGVKGSDAFAQKSNKRYKGVSRPEDYKTCPIHTLLYHKDFECYGCVTERVKK